MSWDLDAQELLIGYGMSGSCRLAPYSSPVSVIGSLPSGMRACAHPQISLMQESVTGIGPTRIQYDLVLNRLCLQRLYIQIKLHLQVWGLGLQSYLLGDTIQPTPVPNTILKRGAPGT